MSDPKQPPPPSPGDLEKLVGPWTAGSIADADRHALLKGAIENQALFDALADEEGVRELLADPAARAELAEVLEESQAPANPVGARPEAAAAFPAAPMARRAGAPQPAAAPVSERDRQPLPWWRAIFTPAPMAGFGLAAAAVFAFVMLRPQALVKDQAQTVREAPAAEVALNTQPSLPPPPGAAAESDASRKSERPAAAAPAARRAMRDSETEARAREEAAPPPPQPQPLAVPASPPPAPASAPAVAVVAEASPVGAVATEEKAKRSAQASAAAPPPPAPRAALRFRIERQQANGEWVEFGGELGRGDRARLAVVAPAEGVLSVAPAGGGVVATLKASGAGETVYYPATGSLPSEAGEREFVLAFSQEPNPARVSNFLVGPPQALGGQATRARKSPASERAPGASADAAVAAGPAMPPLVTATVRLRYR